VKRIKKERKRRIDVQTAKKYWNQVGSQVGCETQGKGIADSVSVGNFEQKSVG